MKTKHALLVLVSFALAHCAVSVSGADPGKSLDELLAIARTEGFPAVAAGAPGIPNTDATAVAYLMAGHADPTRETTATTAADGKALPERPLLRITSFYDSAPCAVVYVVGQNGKWREWKTARYDEQCHYHGQLRAEELSRLQLDLSRLPKSNPTPPIAQTVVISRYRDDTWSRDVYDSAKLPPELKAVMEILTQSDVAKSR